jgi:hypothetical protein
MKKVVLSVSAMLVSIFGFAQANTSNVAQSGVTQTSIVTQNGGANSSDVNQVGVSNKSEVYQGVKPNTYNTKDNKQGGCETRWCEQCRFYFSKQQKQ